MIERDRVIRKYKLVIPERNNTGAGGKGGGSSG